MIRQFSDVQLSLVVRVVGGGIFLKQCLEQLVQQTQAIQAEVIVPYDSSVEGVEILRAEFPGVRFVELEEDICTRSHEHASHQHTLYDLRTAAGLRIARGQILALLEDFGIPDPDWSSQVLKAHELPHAAIGGAVEQAAPGLLNWAVYFLDFGRYQLPLSEGPTQYLTDVNISYKRLALENIRPLWENEYNEVIVNWELCRQNQLLWLRPAMVVRQNRGVLSFWKLLAERYYWGMIFAQKRSSQVSFSKRYLFLLMCPFLPFLFVLRLLKKVISGRRNRVRFIISLPFVFLLAIGWSFGEMIGYMRNKAL